MSETFAGWVKVYSQRIPHSHFLCVLDPGEKVGVATSHSHPVLLLELLIAAPFLSRICVATPGLELSGEKTIEQSRSLAQARGSSAIPLLPGRVGTQLLAPKTWWTVSLCSREVGLWAAWSTAGALPCQGLVTQLYESGTHVCLVHCCDLSA